MSHPVDRFRKENLIEAVWIDFDANVTWNHARRSLGCLFHDVRGWIRGRRAANTAAARRAA